MDDVIFQYTSEQAVEDGYLFDVVKLNKEWGKGPVKYITTGLMSKGYMDGDKVNLPNILDLLNQVLAFFKEQKEPDTFFSLSIELPSGAPQAIYVAQNETGLFTVMLPEDY